MRISVNVVSNYSVNTEGGDTEDPQAVQAHADTVMAMTPRDIEKEGVRHSQRVATDAEVIGPADPDAPCVPTGFPGDDISVRGITDRLLEAGSTEEDRTDEMDYNNMDRAERALRAIHAYWGSDGDEGIVRVLGDMLGDMQHVARMLGVDFQKSLRTGRNHHDEEKDGIY